MRPAVTFETSQHTNIQTYIHTYKHTYIHTNIQTYKHTYIHTYIHTNIHTNIQTYKHTNIHTYVCYTYSNFFCVRKHGNLPAPPPIDRGSLEVEKVTGTLERRGLIGPLIYFRHDSTDCHNIWYILKTSFVISSKQNHMVFNWFPWQPELYKWRHKWPPSWIVSNFQILFRFEL